jgi:preprotein translocase SecF subunit
VDFTTGTNVIFSLKTDQVVSDGDVRSALKGAGFVEPTVTKYLQSGAETKNRFMVHLGETGDVIGGAETTQSTVATRVQDTLGKLAGGPADVDLEKVDMVGPTVGAQLKWDAINALFWSIVFIIVYLSLRFELKFSVGAIVALLHDCAITLGLFAITGRQVSLGVVAAMLTIIGYSLNDTIIVFDRLREDMKLYRGRGFSLLEILDRSVNQTLSRTILTSMLTLFVVIVLLFFGGPTINDFAFALACGIIIGTYSSIFISNPLVYYWQLVASRWSAKHRVEEEPSARRRRKTRTEESIGNKGEPVED